MAIHSHSMDIAAPIAQENRILITNLRYRLLQGLLTYEEARAEAQPIIDRTNACGAEIARESGMRFKPFTFSYLIR